MLENIKQIPQNLSISVVNTVSLFAKKRGLDYVEVLLCQHENDMKDYTCDSQPIAATLQSGKTGKAS